MAYLYEIHVDKSRRREGVGTRLMQQVKHAAENANMVGVLLTAHKANPDLAFYEANDFSPTDIARDETHPTPSGTASWHRMPASPSSCELCSEMQGTA